MRGLEGYFKNDLAALLACILEKECHLCSKPFCPSLTCTLHSIQLPLGFHSRGELLMECKVLLCIGSIVHCVLSTS